MVQVVKILVNKMNKLLTFMDLIFRVVKRPDHARPCSHVKKCKVCLDFVLSVMRNHWWVLSR